MTVKVTNKSLIDGFGSQYQHIISVLLICYKNNYKFYYNPISKMEHNYNNEEDFFERVENLMNIKPYFELCNDEKVQNEQIIIFDMDAKYVIDKNIEEYATQDALQQIKNMFWANKIKDKKIIFKNNEEGVIHVAVHIRRPNKHDNRILGSDTPDEYYLKLIKYIREQNTNEKVRFHIYSQGEPENFEKYLAEDTEFHINEDLMTTFISLVAADILVTSFSSYSYIAAFLNEGTIYAHQFWHTNMKHWICGYNISNSIV